LSSEPAVANEDEGADQQEEIIQDKTPNPYEDETLSEDKHGISTKSSQLLDSSK